MADFPSLPVSAFGSGGGPSSLSSWWSGLSDTDKASIFGAGGSLIGGLLSSSSDTNAAKGVLGSEQSMADKAAGAGQRYRTQADQALGPVLSYFEKLASGDPALALSATAPQRQKVMDQYDVARRSIATGPRGGGTASALTQSYAKEASDLGVLQAGAQSDAEKELGDLGKTLASLGINEDQLAQSGYSDVVKGYLSLAQSQNQSAADLGKGLGTLVGALAFL